MRLSTEQQQALDTLLSQAEGGSGPQPTLLIGPWGAGRRTVAQELAKQLGFGFEEISLAGSGREALRRLFGSNAGTTDEPWLRHTPLLADEPTIVYLSEFDLLADDAAGAIHRVIARRRFVDADGQDRPVSTEVWLLAAVSTKPSARVTPEHWLAAAFPRHVRVEAPIDPRSVAVVAREMLADIRPGTSIDDDALSLLASLSATDGALYTLRRRLEAVVRSTTGSIRRSDVGELLAGELADLDDLRYRGVRVSASSIRDWVAQFPRELEPVGWHLARRIAAEYFISDAIYYRALAELADSLPLERRRAVVLLRWQNISGSAERVNHVLKNLAHLKVVGEVDLRAPVSEWRTPEELEPTFVLADDIVGSGRSLVRLLEAEHQPLLELLRLYPACHAYLFFIVAYEHGIRAMTHHPAFPSERTSVYPWRLLTDRDRCFTPDSLVLPDSEERRGLEDFCRRVARERMRRLRMPLGFEDTGGLVVFHDTVPNNSLPIIWHGTGTWLPLFPASGLATAPAPSL